MSKVEIMLANILASIFWLEANLIQVLEWVEGVAMQKIKLELVSDEANQAGSILIGGNGTNQAGTGSGDSHGFNSGVPEGYIHNSHDLR